MINYCSSKPSSIDWLSISISPERIASTKDPIKHLDFDTEMHRNLKRDGTHICEVKKEAGWNSERQEGTWRSGGAGQGAGPTAGLAPGN